MKPTSPMYMSSRRSAETRSYRGSLVARPATVAADVAFRLAVCSCSWNRPGLNDADAIHELWCAKTRAARIVEYEQTRDV